MPITNEAIEFLLQTGRISLTSSGELGISAKTKILSRTRCVDAEVADCLKKGEHIAKWFAGAGKVENIYIGLGVRP